MANKPFDRTILYALEKPFADDVNQAQSQFDRSIRELVQRTYAPRASDAVLASGTPINGFLSDGFRVKPDPALNVILTAGLGFFYDGADIPALIASAGTSDLAPYKPILLSADQTIAIGAAPAAGNNRIDIVEIKTDRKVGEPTSRETFNTLTQVFDPATINKILSFDLLGDTGVTNNTASTTAIGYKRGVQALAGTEVAPATTAGYTKIAEVLVSGGDVATAANKIKDLRDLLYPLGIGHVAVRCGAAAVVGVDTFPAIANFIAPPGFAAVVRQPAGFSTAASELYISYPASAQFGGIAGTVNIDNDLTVGAAVSFDVVKYHGPIVGVVTPTIQGYFAAGTPAFDVAVGQQYMIFSMSAVHQAAGVTSAGIPGIVEYSIDVVFKK